MPRVSQSDSGKSWEYALACQIRGLYKCQLVNNRAQEVARNAYNLLSQSERNMLDTAANEAACFLLQGDNRLITTRRITIQSDREGQRGDVRDILVQTENEVVGISAKHRHNALKHSRLSGTIDFGKEWYGVPCSPHYWKIVEPLFLDLKQASGMRWTDLPNKREDYYQPVLRAFVNEVCLHGNAKKLMKYILGGYDYYKIVKENGKVSFQSFNMYGSNQWGAKLDFPSRVQSFEIDEKRSAFAVLTGDKGWQVSFRLHNARGEIEPSLKFDILLVGNPNKFTRNEIEYV